MKIKRFEFNMFPVNCYVLWDETKEAVVRRKAGTKKIHSIK